MRFSVRSDRRFLNFDLVDMPHGLMNKGVCFLETRNINHALRCERKAAGSSPARVRDYDFSKWEEKPIVLNVGCRVASSSAVSWIKALAHQERSFITNGVRRSVNHQRKWKTKRRKLQPWLRRIAVPDKNKLKNIGTVHGFSNDLFFRGQSWSSPIAIEHQKVRPKINGQPSGQSCM